MKYRAGYYRYRQLRQIVMDYAKANAKFAWYLGRLLIKADMERLTYCVIPEKRLVYLINPKCGCSSIKRALNNVDESKHYTNAHILPDVVRSYRKKLKANEKNYFKFTVTRNPFKRIVSFYTNKFERAKNTDYQFELGKYLDGVFNEEMTFSQVVDVIHGIPPYLANGHFKPQSYLIDSTGYAMDFIGRLETINSDWQTLQAQFDLQDLPTANKSPSYNYMDYYDLSTLERVREYYQEDIQRFGYEETYNDIKAYLMAKQQGKA